MEKGVQNLMKGSIMAKAIKNGLEILSKNWDCNTVYKYDLGDKMGILSILTNADRQGAKDAIQMFQILEGKRSIEECFARFGFVAVTALNQDKKELN